MNKVLSLNALGCLALVGIGCGGHHGGGGDAGCGATICIPPGTDGGPTDGSVVGHDAARRDSGSGGGPSCDQGAACMPDRGCTSTSDTCEAEMTVDLVGGAMDPITGLPGGGASIMGTIFNGGYCTTTAGTVEGMPGACNPDDGTGCGDCGSCLSLGSQMVGGPRETFCAQNCVPSQTTNSCRPGYACLFDSGHTAAGDRTGVCFMGCQSDAQCRVYREDTNMNGRFDTGTPPPDHLVYDTTSMATCNMTTGRCTQPAGANTAGATCTKDSECEADGECLSEVNYGFAGGYCTKRGCDVPGRECAGTGSVCQDVGINLCLQGCSVGAEPMADQTGAMGHGAGCRPTYSCQWNGASGAGVPHNGGCIPGGYNDITLGAATGQVGQACGASMHPEDECYSPYGYGRCIAATVTTTPRESGFCTVIYCDAPGIGDVCGPNAQCLPFFADAQVCLKNCTAPSDCPASYGCTDFDMMAATPKVCLPLCTADADCQTGYHCNMPMAGMAGTCERTH